MDAAHQALADAADYITTHGHHKGSYFPRRPNCGWTPTPPACATGAIRMVTVGFPEFGSVWGDACELLDSHIKEFDGIPQWNDAPDTTAEDVILTLKRAAHAD